MEHNVLNGNFACSTLIIGNFDFLKITFPRFLEGSLDSSLMDLFIIKRMGQKLLSGFLISPNSSRMSQDSANLTK